MVLVVDKLTRYAGPFDARAYLSSADLADCVLDNLDILISLIRSPWKAGSARAFFSLLVIRHVIPLTRACLIGLASSFCV